MGNRFKYRHIPKYQGESQAGQKYPPPLPPRKSWRERQSEAGPKADWKAPLTPPEAPRNAVVHPKFLSPLPSYLHVPSRRQSPVKTFNVYCKTLDHVCESKCDSGAHPQTCCGGTNTLHKIFKVGQGFMGIAHPQKLTGYKAPNAYGFRPIFQSETTNSYFQNQVRKIGENATVFDKKLQPYYPNAPRNRPSFTLQSFVGARAFDRRNASYLRLVSGNPRHMRTPKTLNQTFMSFEKDPPGMCNQGIFSDRAKRIHNKIFKD